MQVNFTQAIDHLKVGDDVGNGKIIKIEAGRIDVEVVLPNAVVITHYDASHEGLFEIDETKASPELKRRAAIIAMTSEQRFDALMSEIKKLEDRIVALEK